MENTTNEVENNEAVAETTPVSESTEAVNETETAPEPQQPMTKEEQLNALISKRMGNFDVKVTYDDLKYVRNTLSSKSKFVGANQAYMLIIASLSVESALTTLDPKVKDAVNVPFQSAVVESINYFINKIEGTGRETAQRVFSLSMIFRQAMVTIQSLDKEIEALKQELGEGTQNSAE